jgi:sporulation protein YlmC with PRC-barrel domain
MLMKSIAAGLAGTALLATVAFAQSPTATTDTPSSTSTASTTSTTASGQWRTSKMDGIKVYNDANENIGSISDLLMDKSGNIKIAVIGVGGFLGLGEHLVAVPYEKLKFVNEPVAYTGTAGNTATGAGNTAANRPAATTTTGAATGTDNRPATPATNTSASSSSKWYPDHAVFNASKDELKNMRARFWPGALSCSSSPLPASGGREKNFSASPAGSRPCRADGRPRRRARWRSACRGPTRPWSPRAS